jgi:hypothetical protein
VVAAASRVVTTAGGLGAREVSTSQKGVRIPGRGGPVSRHHRLVWRGVAPAVFVVEVGKGEQGNDGDWDGNGGGSLAGWPSWAHGPYVTVTRDRGGWDTDTWGCHGAWVTVKAGGGPS